MSIHPDFPRILFKGHGSIFIFIYPTSFSIKGRIISDIYGSSPLFILIEMYFLKFQKIQFHQTNRRLVDYLQHILNNITRKT